jgi:hypothetical protein
VSCRAKIACRFWKITCWVTNIEDLRDGDVSGVGKVKSNPIRSLDRPLGFHEVEAPRFLDNPHMKVVRLSALRIGRLYLPGNIPGTYFCWRLSRPQGHSATETIVSKVRQMMCPNDVDTGPFEVE